MDPASAVFGIVSGVIELYRVVKTTYELYTDIKDFPSTYQELYFCFQIERKRVELWGENAFSEDRKREIEESPSYESLWRFIETILHRILEAFSEAGAKIGAYGDSTNEGLLDFELVEQMAALKKSSKRSRLTDLARSAKFVLKDKEKLKKLTQKLCYWNDSLNKMTSHLDQESYRRRLRAHLSTCSAGHFKQLELAAALLQHHDIESMAYAQDLVDQIHRSEKIGQDIQSTETGQAETHFKLDDFNWPEPPLRAGKSRTTAIYQNETVFIDWRICRDDAWRKGNLAEFKRRTVNLAKLLNCDLRPLNLSVLHCLGYLNPNANESGYAFRPPSEAQPGQKPMSLYDIMDAGKGRGDIPDLGERFMLAKALVTTIFEIHNFGWMHKNIQSKNVLFWPKLDVSAEPNLSKPYIVGFDISRLNQPGEMSEKPVLGTEDDLYRHPEYQGDNPKPFLPSYDMYSIGVMLFEIGMWRPVDWEYRDRKSQSSSTRAAPALDIPYDRFVDEVLMNKRVTKLKCFTGTRYLEAVKKCLNKDLDAIWKDGDVDSQQRKGEYLEAVQSEVVERISMCRA